MITLNTKNKEIDITLKYSETLEKVKIDILGEGDLSHHLIEGLFDLIDRLSRMEKVGHASKDWRTR